MVGFLLHEQVDIFAQPGMARTGQYVLGAQHDAVQIGFDIGQRQRAGIGDLGEFGIRTPMGQGVLELQSRLARLHVVRLCVTNLRM